MRKLMFTCGILLVVAIVVAPLVRLTGRADDQPAKPISAKELGKQWRYPGTSNDPDIKASDPNWIWEVVGPLGDKAKSLDRTTMQFAQPKASFEKVWNYYAGKCGYSEKWKKNHIVGVIQKTEGNGQRLVIDQTPGMRADSGGPEETDFGLFTENYVIHVQIRKVDAEQTAIRILTTIACLPRKASGH